MIEKNQKVWVNHPTAGWMPAVVGDIIQAGVKLDKSLIYNCFF